jgi:hypothetical protein
MLKARFAAASWAGAFEFASKRHPVATAIAGLGIALGRWWRSEIAPGAAASPISRYPLGNRPSRLSVLQARCFGNALHSSGGNLFELLKHESLLARRDYPTRWKESWTMLLIRSPAEARSDR